MKNLFAKYLQSVCSPDEFREITQWMSRMDNSQTVSLFMKPHWERLMQQESDVPANHALWEKIKLAIEEKEKAETQRRLKIYTWGIRVAAVLVLGLLVSNLFFIQNFKQPETFVQTQSVSVPHGARTSFALPDGSVVWLNSGSTLSYSSEFTDNRSLELEGEAYFEVIKSENPFTVTTAMGKVEVTGTTFNVKVLPDEKQFETTVEEGSVLVSALGLAQKASLSPGAQARLVNGKWEMARVETELYTSWKEGKIIFRRAYLPEVAQRLERWYNVSIEMTDDPRLQKIHYTGTLEMESFSEVLELLKVTAPINYTYNDKTRVIRITHR
jgi:transmembrane sensor